MLFCGNPPSVQKLTITNVTLERGLSFRWPPPLHVSNRDNFIEQSGIFRTPEQSKTLIEDVFWNRLLDCKARFNEAEDRFIVGNVLLLRKPFNVALNV
jgi:hypothetical protein